MSIECRDCERDLRGPHAKDCPRVHAETAKLLKEAIKILKASGTARLLNRDFIRRAMEHKKEYL